MKHQFDKLYKESTSNVLVGISLVFSDIKLFKLEIKLDFILFNYSNSGLCMR